MTLTEAVEKRILHSDSLIQEFNRMLVRYDMTPNQAKVYLFLSKIGVKTASEISKALKISRPETYHLLSTLRQKGIIFSAFGKPTKFNSVGLKESLEILLNNKKNRINELESRKDSLIKLWNTIPNYAENDKELQENKFRSLQGRNSILVKLEQIIKESKENILGNLNDKQIDAVNEIYISTLKLQILIEDILTMQKLDLGKIGFNQEDTNVSELLLSIIKEFKPIALEKKYYLGNEFR